MKARPIIKRETLKATFTLDGYYAESRGDVLPHCLRITEGRIKKGDYFFDRKIDGEGSRWIKAIGAIGELVADYGAVSRPIGQVDNP
jgi:hypothetical protein